MKCKECPKAQRVQEEWMSKDEYWVNCPEHSPYIGYILDGEMECEDVNYNPK